MDDRETCIGCTYFEQDCKGSIDGECHRLPPIAPFMAGPGWARVHTYDWCGELKPISREELRTRREEVEAREQKMEARRGSYS